MILIAILDFLDSLFNSKPSWKTIYPLFMTNFGFLIKLPIWYVCNFKTGGASFKHKYWIFRIYHGQQEVAADRVKILTLNTCSLHLSISTLRNLFSITKFVLKLLDTWWWLNRGVRWISIIKNLHYFLYDIQISTEVSSRNYLTTKYTSYFFTP